MRQPNVKLRCSPFVLGLFLAPLLAGAARAQTTSFTYQGRLTDGGKRVKWNLRFTVCALRRLLIRRDTDWLNSDPLRRFGERRHLHCATGFYLGRAMIHVVRNGAPKRMLENRDLRTLGEA